jgi:hypothetical protein
VIFYPKLKAEESILMNECLSEWSFLFCWYNMAQYSLFLVYISKQSYFLYQQISIPPSSFPSTESILKKSLSVENFIDYVQSEISSQMADNLSQRILTKVVKNLEKFLADGFIKVSL